MKGAQKMRSIKQRLSSAYNRHHGRRRTLWEEWFRATAVGGNIESALTVAAYIDLNAVRAGLCKPPKDYRWCGYAEAVVGDRRYFVIRFGLQRHSRFGSVM